MQINILKFKSFSKLILFFSKFLGKNLNWKGQVFHLDDTGKIGPNFFLYPRAPMGDKNNTGKSIPIAPNRDPKRDWQKLLAR